ncbi:hypothetical protein D9M71_671810 [compost metagenome]
MDDDSGIVPAYSKSGDCPMNTHLERARQKEQHGERTGDYRHPSCPIRLISKLAAVNHCDDQRCREEGGFPGGPHLKEPAAGVTGPVIHPVLAATVLCQTDSVVGYGAD